MPPYTSSWHEAVGGRSAQEICSAIKLFIDFHRFIFWTDNCSSHNKCWFVYTAFAMIVNGKDLLLNSITLKYFERGHTLLSADSYHYLVEKTMNAKKNDFEDFVKALENNGKAIIMKPSDFMDFPTGVSEKSEFADNKPNMDSIRVAKFLPRINEVNLERKV